MGAGTILVSAVPNTVTICHNGQTITVSGCALAAHLEHGDQIGPCDNKSSVAFIEEDETAASLSVYPNPSKDMMHLSFTSDEQESYTLQVFDITGRLMLSEEKEAIIGENEHELNIGDYNPGMYFLVVKKGNNVMQTKLVKE